MKHHKRGHSQLNYRKPVNRAGHILLQRFDNKLFLFGGYHDDGDLTDLWTKTPEDSTWSNASTWTTSISPFPRLETEGCIIGSDVYVFGGMSIANESVSIFNDLWKLDTSETSLKWIQLFEESPVPERHGHAVVGVKNRYVMIHGGECARYFDDVWIYDTTTNTWIEVVTVGIKPRARCNHSMTVCESKSLVVLFGGITKDDDNDAGPVYLNDMWLLNFDDENPMVWEWKPLHCTDIAPSPRDLPAMLTLNDSSIIIYGGYGLSEIIDSVTVDEDPAIDDDVEAMKVSNISLAEGIVPVEATETAIVEASDADELGDAQVVEEYLSDAWIIEIHSGKTHELGYDLRACRGSKLYLMHSFVCSLGGFDGNQFLDDTRLLDYTQPLANV